MKRVSYHLIAIQTAKLISNFAMAPSYERHERWNDYLTFIEACGWSDNEINNMILQEVDNSWVESTTINYNINLRRNIMKAYKFLTTLSVFAVLFATGCTCHFDNQPKTPVQTASEPVFNHNNALVKKTDQLVDDTKKAAVEAYSEAKAYVSRKADELKQDVEKKIDDSTK